MYQVILELLPLQLNLKNFYFQKIGLLLLVNDAIQFFKSSELWKEAYSR